VTSRDEQNDTFPIHSLSQLRHAVTAEFFGLDLIEMRIGALWFEGCPWRPAPSVQAFLLAPSRMP